VGDYISIGRPSGNRALAVDGTVYVAYGDLDDNDQLYVMSSTGGGWSSVGMANGIAIYDDETTATLHQFGTYPSIVPYGSGLLMVYISGSGSVAGSLSYPGSDDHWEEADSGYWTSGDWITGSDTALVLDTAGAPVAALQSGVGVKLYRNSAGTWSPHLGTFDPDDGSNNLYLRGFQIDNTNTPYLAYETLTYGSPPLFHSDIARWSGSSWSSTGFHAAIGTPEHIMDVAILEHPGGTGILAVAACSSGTEYWIGLWAYDGATWQRSGPLLEGLDGVGNIALGLDADGRPVLVYATGDKALTAIRLIEVP
jgi:hypothetical protein